MSEVEFALTKIREKRLDLSRRNRLLNLSFTAKSLRVIDELPDEVYRLLVTAEKRLGFVPMFKHFESEAAVKKPPSTTNCPCRPPRCGKEYAVSAVILVEPDGTAVLTESLWGPTGPEYAFNARQPPPVVAAQPPVPPAGLDRPPDRVEACDPCDVVGLRDQQVD